MKVGDPTASGSVEEDAMTSETQESAGKYTGQCQRHKETSDTDKLARQTSRDTVINETQESDDKYTGTAPATQGDWRHRQASEIDKPRHTDQLFCFCELVPHRRQTLSGETRDNAGDTGRQAESSVGDKDKGQHVLFLVNCLLTGETTRQSRPLFSR